jgi:hypothetical protein
VWANGFASVVTTDAEIRASKNVAADEGSARLGADPTTKRISRRAGGQGSGTATGRRALVNSRHAEAEVAKAEERRLRAERGYDDGAYDETAEGAKAEAAQHHRQAE